MIVNLYTVQQQAKENGLDTISLKELRQQHSQPILEKIRHCLEYWFIEVLPKSPIGQVVSYARGQWKMLNRYTEDGDIDINNNIAERVLRIVAIGRKNWLIAGSDACAERAAIIAKKQYAFSRARLILRRYAHLIGLQYVVWFYWLYL